MAGSKDGGNTEAGKKLMKGLGIDPAKAEEAVDNKNAVNNMIAAGNRNARTIAKAPGIAFTRTPDGQSQFDEGYNPSQGNLETHRAIQQTGWDQAANKTAAFVPKVGLGVVELGGHILDLPDNIYGMVSNGKSMFSDEPNDFNNWMSEYAKDASEHIQKEWAPVYRKNPEKTWDLGDSGWWMDAAFDTVESITEFLITGMGVGAVVGKGAGALSKGLSAAAKATMPADMVAAGIKAAQGTANYAGKLMNSAVTSESISALNATQTFQTIYNDTMGAEKEDGTKYTEEEAKEAAALGASHTFESTLAATTLLNITSLSPFIKPKGFNIKAKGSNTTEHLASLKAIRDNAAKKALGAKTYAKIMKKAGGVAGESLQEGIEEVSENVSQQLGEMDAKQALGRENGAIDIATSENALAFTLGAFGGSFAKGFHAMTGNTEANYESQYLDYVDAQVNAVENHMRYSQNIQDLQAKNPKDMTQKEYASTMNDITQNEVEMISNTITHGLDDGTVAIMEQEIANQIKDETSEGVDKDSLKIIQSSIKKHRKMMKQLSTSPETAAIGMMIVNSSIKHDLYTNKRDNANNRYNEALQSYSGTDAIIASKVNRLAALESSAKDGQKNLTEEQHAEVELLKMELQEFPIAKRNKLRNSNLMTIAAEAVFMEQAMDDSMNDFNKASNPDTADEFIQDAEEVEDNLNTQMEAQQESSASISATEETVAASTSVAEIDDAIAKGTAALKNPALNDTQKEALAKRLDVVKANAEKKKDDIRKSNLTKNTVDNTDPVLRSVATKMLKQENGEEVEGYTPEEVAIIADPEMKDKLNLLKKKMKQTSDPASEKVVESPVNGEPIDPSLPEDSTLPEGTEPTVPEDATIIGSLDEFSGISEQEKETPADDKVESEKSPTSDPAPLSDVNDHAAEETKADPPTTVDSVEASPEPILADQEIVTFGKQLRYHKFYAPDTKKEPSNDKKQVKLAEAQLAKWKDQLAKEGDTMNPTSKRFLEMRITLLADQLKRIDLGFQTRVFLPKISNTFGFEPHDLTHNQTGKDVPVTEIFESVNGVLLVNTTEVMPGQEVEVVYDPEWPYFMPSGVAPMLVYRVINGKRASKPIAELPFRNIEEGSLTDLMRKNVAAGRTKPFQMIISGKNFGDLVTESNADGTRAQNPISAAITSSMPATFGFMYDSRYKIENYNPSDYTPAQRKAIEEFNESVINPDTTRTMGINDVVKAEGTHFILMVGPNGKILPAYMDAKTINESDSSKLLGKGEADGGVKNMADILREGRYQEGKNTSTGIVNLKKLMSAAYEGDTGVIQYIKDNPRKTMVVTPKGVMWKTKGVDGIEDGSWLRVDYRIKDVADFNPLGDMLAGKDFNYQIFAPETLEKQVAPGGDGHYFKAKAGSTESSRVTGDLTRQIGETKYNISKDFMNTDLFIDAFGENTGGSYNEHVMKSGNFTTDVTTADQKFINANLRIRPRKTESKTDQTGRIQVAESDQKAAEKINAERVQVAKEAETKENEEVTQPTEETPIPDDAKDRPLTNREKARRRHEGTFRLANPNRAEGYSSMSKAEIDLLMKIVGNVDLVRNVDSVLTVGGREALGYFHNSMVTIAEKAEEGTGYHEAFHYVSAMGLTTDQRKAVYRQARQKFGKDLSDKQIEEALADDFMAYMLEKEKSPRGHAIKKFFKSIVAYIEKILGMNPSKLADNTHFDILSLYDDIATNNWKTVYKDQFSSDLEPDYIRYKLVKDFTTSSQESMLKHASSEIVNIAKEAAKEHQTVSDILSDRARLLESIDLLKNRFNELYLRDKEEADNLAELDRELTDTESALLVTNDYVKFALDSWEQTESTSEEDQLNPPANFKDELIKHMQKFGFQVSVTTKIKDDSQTEPLDPANPEGLIIEKNTNQDETRDDEESENQHIYNMDLTLKDTKKTLSTGLKRKLSMLPVYELDSKNNMIKNSDGTYKIKKNIFGGDTYHDFNSTYSNMKTALADIPISKLYQTIAAEAQHNPLFAAIEYSLNEELSKDSTADEYWNGFMSELMSAFNNATYNLVTVKSGAISKSANPEIIFIDRATVYKVVNDNWATKAQSNDYNLVDENFMPIKENWEAINDEYNADLKRLGMEPTPGTNEHAQYENNAMAMIRKYLNKTGLKLDPKALPSVKKNFSNSYQNALRGERSSLQAIILRGAKGNEAPFGNEAILNGFSKSQGKFENDINSGTVFANGKQLHSINMPSYINDFLNNLKAESESGESNFISMFTNDKFYVPRSDTNKTTNLLVEYFMNPKNLEKARITQFFDFKDGKEAKEYDGTNLEQSFIQKVIAGSFSGKSTGHFSLGTLSDKLKSVGLEVPISNDLASAKVKLVDAYKRTVYQEMHRIKNMSNPEYAERFPNKDASKFIYLPELNGPEFIALHNNIMKGDMTPEQFNEFFNNDVVPALEKKVETDLNTEIERLKDQKILVDQSGVITPSDNALKHLSTDGKNGMEAIQKFLVEDRMWKMEMSKVFMGDMAKYDGFWDYFKRMYQLVTPGRVAYVNSEVENASHRETMNRLIIKSPRSTFGIDQLSVIADGILSDSEQTAKAIKGLQYLIDQETTKEGEPAVPLKGKKLQKILTAMAKRGEDGPKITNAIQIAYAYRSNNRGDAASYVSIDFFRDQKKGLGEWDKDYEWIFNNVWNAKNGKGQTVEDATKGMSEEDRAYYKAKDTKLTADALKPFYYGPRPDDITDPETGNKVGHVLYEQYKDSMMPLLPIWASKVSGFDWMVDQFKNNKVDVISTDDAVKVGLFGAIEMGADNDTVAKAVRTGIPTKNLRYPQPSAKIKDKALAGTQLQKIIMSNLSALAKYHMDSTGEKMSAQELSNHYNDVFSEKIDRSYNGVLKKLGVENNKDIVNIDNLRGEKKKRFLINLRNLVNESVTSQGKSESYVDALNIIPTGDNNYDYELGMSFDAYSRSYQNIIMSVVRSNVFRQELPGGSMVNMADLTVKTDDQLKFITYKNGKTIPGEIAMPNVMAKKNGVGWGIMTEDGKPTVDASGNVLYENLSEEQAKAMEIVIYRIPTQMKSSTLPVIVKRILPDSDGAKMMLPGEMTTQAGLDFDFDKSYMISRVFGEKNLPEAGMKPSDMNDGQINNELFDIHWSVLTNGAHFEEMMTPVSSRTHTALAEEYQAKNALNPSMALDPFNSVTNIEMEGLSKHSHVMRGTFSKFAGGHNVMNNIRVALEGTGKSINDYIQVNTPIKFAPKNGYYYNEFGKERDSNGKYISENHSENLNSALDSQKDPVLGKLNTSIFNSFATGYMIDLGVPDSTVKRFMNSEVLKKLSDAYFMKGGMPYVMNDAVNTVIKDMGLDPKVVKRNKTSKSASILSEADFDSTSQDTQAKILGHFIMYNAASKQVATLNNLLSPETQKIGDAANLRQWNTKYDQLINSQEDGHIAVNDELFNTATSPVKKIASFHEKGIGLSNDLIRGLFPYFTSYYNDTIDQVLLVQNMKDASNWKMFDDMHKTIDMISLVKTSESEGKSIIEMVSPGFMDRISLYKGQGKPTMIDRFKEIKKLGGYSIDNNDFIAALSIDKYNSRNTTQLLNFPNATDNNEQQKILAGFDRMVRSGDPVVAEFGRDLVAYTIATSGFSKNSHSFVMMIPTTYWANSGVGNMMKQAKFQAKSYSSTGVIDQGSVEAIVRTLGPSSTVIPNAETDHLEKKEDGGFTRYILNDDSPLVPNNEEMPPPMFIKSYDKDAREYKLFKLDDSGLNTYVESSFFGDPNRSNEVFTNPNLFVPGSSSVVPKVAKKPTQEEVERLAVNESMATMPTTPEAVEKKNTGLEEMSETPPLPPDVDVIAFKLAEERHTLRPGFTKEMEAKLQAFLDNNNISVTVLESMKERFGVNADGVADSLNRAIFLAKGDAGRNAKPEEIAHIYVESTLNTRQTKAMLEQVEGTEEYEDVKKRYGKLYKNDDYKLRREAAAKIIANQILAQKPTPKTKLGRAIEAFMNMIKRTFGQMSVFEMATQDIIAGQVVGQSATKRGLMFELSDDVTPNPVDETNEVDLSDENIASFIEEGTADEKKQQKAEEEYNRSTIESEIEDFENLDFGNVAQETAEAVALLKESLGHKGDRLKAKAKTQKDLGNSAGVAALVSKMGQLDDSKALGAYMLDVAERIKNINEFYAILDEKGTMTPEDLYEMDEELNSFGNLKHVFDFMEESDLTQKQNDSLKVILADIEFERKAMQKKVSRKLKDVMAPILAELTSENITEEKIGELLKAAPKDVSFLSKWLVSGIESTDLLVRVTQKVINNAKYEAEAKLAKFVNEEGGLKDVEIEFENWAKSQGIDIGKMAERNDMFLTRQKGKTTEDGTKLNDKWYIVNKKQGKEKFDALMAMDDNHPAKKFYKKIVQMHMKGQEGVEMTLGKKPFGYQLPRMRKNKTELVSEGKGVKGVGNAFKEFWRSMSFRKDDDELGYRSSAHYETDENGDILKDIPIFFKTNMDADEVSLDISTSVKGSTSNMLQHAAISDNQGTLWALEKLANERKVRKPGSASFKGGKESNLKAFMPGSESNVAKQIKLIKDQHMFGETKQETTFTFGGKTFDLNGLSKFLNWFTSFKIMPFNLNIALSNAITGNAMLVQEALGGEFFNGSDWKFGGKLAGKEIGPLMADMFRRKKHSKMGVAMEFLNLEQDFKTSMEALGQRSAGVGKAVHAAEKISRGLQEGSQGFVMTQTLGAMMHNTVVQDAQGNDLILWEAFDAVNGNMVFKEGLTYEGKPLAESMEAIRNKMVHAHEKIHGVYNTMDAPAFSASIIGQQMMFFRGWLIEPIRRRFQGKQFSERTEGYDEGTYRAMMTYWKNVFGPDGSYMKFENYAQIVFNTNKKEEFLLDEDERENLSEEEKADLMRKRLSGIRKTRAEIAMFTTFFMLAMAMGGLDDDDEEDGFVFDFSRYHILRAKREMMFYSPFELVEIIKNPSISSTVIKDGLNLGWQGISLPYNMITAEDDDAPLTDIFNKIGKMAPLVSQIKSMSDLSRAADAIEQGFR